MTQFLWSDVWTLAKFMVEEWQLSVVISIWAKWKFSVEWKIQKRVALSGRSLTVSCFQVMDQIDQHIRNNWRIGIDGITSEMGISDGNKLCKNGVQRSNLIFFYEIRKFCGPLDEVN
jgi:hypothetical protein